MIYYRFAIISFLVLLFNRSCFCDLPEMCPQNLFELLNEKCLEQEHNIGQLNGVNLDWREILNIKIECSKVGLCKRYPWQMLDKKIKLVRRYAKCMNGINGIIETWEKINLIQPNPDNRELYNMVTLEHKRCRNNLFDKFPKSE